MSSFLYCLREAFTGFKRNFSTALGSIVTIFLSLMIIGLFLVIGVVVNNVVSSVEDEVSITCYVADDATDEAVQEVMDYIETLDGVASVSFTTKDEALEEFSKTNSTDIIDTLDGENPLPASIDVELSDAQLVEDVAGQIEENTVFAGIADEDDPADSIKYGQQSVEKLLTLTQYIRYIGAGLIILLIFIALVFINNTIRLSIMARKREIGIMRLVGASNGFIRGPFLMEGALHAIIGSLLAVLVLELVRRFALPQLQEAIMFLSFDIGLKTFLAIYVFLIVLGLVIGLIGSALAMRRYLKV